MKRTFEHLSFRRHFVLFPANEWLSLAALFVLTLVLAVAGGASYPDVPAQVVVRGGAAIVLCILIAFGRPRGMLRYRPLWFFLLALSVLILVQLIPLPEGLWSRLPGHSSIAERFRDLDLPRPSRPINLVPDKGLNTLFAMIVPVTMLATLTCLGARGEAILRPLLIMLALGSAVAGLLQAAGAIPQSWLMNGNSANYGGLFANRNHQALFLSIGIAAALFWGQEKGRDVRRPRLWLACASTAILGLSILLTGSRVGIVLSLLAIMSGFAFGEAGGRSRPRHGRYLAAGLGLVLGGILVAFAIYLGRANAFDRLAALSAESDIRYRAFGPVWGLAKSYFPFGSGFGSFDAVFRNIEPIDLLRAKYLNHAHNDFLEFLLEGGVGAACLLAVAMVWVCRRGWPAFSSGGNRNARLGLIIIALVALASVFDYPLRTPLIMATVLLAGCWLAQPHESQPSLPRS